MEFIFMLSVLFFLALTFVVLAILVASLWKIFEKAGEPGWASLIPVYNTYILLKIVGMNPVWCFIPLIINIFSQMLSLFIKLLNLGSLFYLVSAIVDFASFTISLYLFIATSIYLSRSFHKNNGFTVGLLFLPIFFYPVLGFGKDQYVGSYISKNPTDSTTQYCLGCGRKVVDQSVKFCPNCGHALKN